ncbi:hypothetical protein PV11_01778 [Exophiala sideris]|uniref:Uncharacterized protein n=1 Tax=Exophiala sideris TaxID=1016849 RepID=A0A0D1YX82_9EURO|nr:hypothetical protein PV11_01778 [Exophiala sideris]
MATSNKAAVAHNNGDHGTKASKRGRRGRAQRLRCEHPGCGKSGHSIDRCWIAHPELRPHNVLKDSEKSSKDHLSGQQTAKHSPPTPFRFMDLPAEIRTPIYEAVHAQGSALTFRKHGTYPTETHVCWQDVPNLFLVSKKVYAETAYIRGTRNAFNGHMRFEIRPAGFDTQATHGPLLPCANKLTFFGYNSYNMFATTFDRRDWGGIGWFSNVREIHVEWSMLRYKYKPGSNNTYSKAWRHLWQPGTLKAFYNGEQDCDLSWYTPDERLKLNHLLWLLKQEGLHCKLFVTIMAQWLDNEQMPVFNQEIKYSLKRGGCNYVLYRRAYRAPRNSVPVY